MAATTAPQTVAGHPIAMKVGGRRMSMSKSPSAQKSFLASSPPKQSEVPKSSAATTTEGDSIKSPTTDDYPRPTDGAEHAHKEKEGDKEEHKKDEASKKKDKQAFEHVKQQNFNKNPPAHNNFNIKQPAGKTL